ncbi:LacI family DNA-binding transcriptional regulator [Alteribacter populi]|uniref:LacI family DNA-binding transcriptional regulator n=1 Tax=Alteribacter populi TaxID=2011011 RepID=UPI000BBA81F2|nr:LacI family DNA-binding transcriptional regulator [Alteribacter populi]
MIRLKDIAEHVGVSISTVSRVIKNDPTRKVNEQTKRKVWEAVKELGYTPNENARNLVTNNNKGARRTMRVGWVVNPQLVELSPYFSTLASGVSETLTELGYTPINISKEQLENETIMMKTIHESGIEGLILIDDIGDETIHYIRKYLPVIGLDFFYSNKNISLIDYDRSGAVKVLVQHLVEQGHRHIGFIGGGVGDNFEDMNNEQRFKGFQATLKDFGLPYNPEWVMNTGWIMEKSYEGMKALINNHDHSLPSAMVCASDLMAIAAMRAVIEHNLRIPEDITFVGIDNIELAKYSTPPLTTIDIPKFGLGSMAAKAIVDIISGNMATPVKILLPFNLIIRESSKVSRVCDGV